MIAIVFWVVLVILAIIEIALVENAAIGWATGLVVASVTAANYFGLITVWPFIQHNPITVVWLFLAYITVGTCYSVLKWTSYVYAKAAECEEEIKRYPNLRPSSQPMAYNNKDLIIAWMAYWPFSAIWTIINDPIRRSFNFIYNQLSSFLQSISDRAFAKFQPQPKVGD